MQREAPAERRAIRVVLNKLLVKLDSRSKKEMVSSLFPSVISKIMESTIKNGNGSVKQGKLPWSYSGAQT